MPNALISVHDKKDGSIEFGVALAERGWNVWGSGGTATALREVGVDVVNLYDYLGEPICDGRVRTLHPVLHAALLYRDGNADDLADIKAGGLVPFDLFHGGLYPLEAELEGGDCSLASVTKNTDVGGHAMLRAAAKAGRITVIDPTDRQLVLGWLDSGRPDEEVFKSLLRAKAFLFTSYYDMLLTGYHSGGRIDGVIGTQFGEDLRYGENPWQTPAKVFQQFRGFNPGSTQAAALSEDPLARHNFEQLAGSGLGFINGTDLDALLAYITHIAASWKKNFGKVPHIMVGVKHGNACCVAVGWDPVDVAERAIGGNPIAIMGGFIIANYTIDNAVVKALRTHLMEKGKRRKLDGVVAPDYTEAAIHRLGFPKHNCQILKNPALADLDEKSLDKSVLRRQVRGGWQQQPNYTFVLDVNHPEMEKHGADPTEQQLADLTLARAICGATTSNTITLVKDNTLIGNGLCRPSRVAASKSAIQDALERELGNQLREAVDDAMRQAAESNLNLQGATAASDSFFPFPDALEVLVAADVAFIFATSGANRDDEVAEARGAAIFWRLPNEFARGFCRH